MNFLRKLGIWNKFEGLYNNSTLFFIWLTSEIDKIKLMCSLFKLKFRGDGLRFGVNASRVISLKMQFYILDLILKWVHSQAYIRKLAKIYNFNESFSNQECSVTLTVYSEMFHFVNWQLLKQITIWFADFSSRFKALNLMISNLGSRIWL